MVVCRKNILDQILDFGKCFLIKTKLNILKTQFSLSIINYTVGVMTTESCSPCQAASSQISRLVAASSSLTAEDAAMKFQEARPGGDTDTVRPPA